MKLRLFARRYVERRDISPAYAACLLSRARAIENHVGRPEIAACFCEASVNRFLAAVAQKVAPITVKGYRADLLTLWLAAADEGLCDYPRRRLIRPARVPQQVVECFTVDEARHLLAAAKGLRRTYPHGVRAKDYWQAAIRLAWDSGLRRADCWRFRMGYVDADGVWRCVQHKTGSLASGRLHDSTIAALERLGTDPPCAWPRRSEAFCRQFSRLVAAAGVRPGTFRWLRRSSGSYVEAEHPGQGHRHLGHSSPEVFRRHYDARLGEAPVCPPEL